MTGGLLAVSRAAAGSSAAAVATLVGIGLMLGLARENARLRAASLASARTDALTGLDNRQRFDETLAAELDKARRLHYPLGLLVVNVDGFNSLNGAYGGAVGDALLRAVAARLRRGVRGIDAVARIGGDEFGVILPGAAAADIKRVGEKLARSISGSLCRVDGRSLRVTVTMGGASFPDQARTAARLLSTADQALYFARARGRSGVAVRRRPH